jgi:hypothetical protein
MIKPAVKLIQANAITGAVERYVKKFFMVSIWRINRLF